MDEISRSKELMAASNRQPFQTYLMGVCVLISIPIVFGQVPPPASVEALLQPFIVQFWGGALIVGGCLSLLGSILKNRVSGLLIEQLGLVFVGVAAILYSVVIIFFVGIDANAVYSAALNFAFGMACLVRWRQIQKFVHSFTQMSHEESMEGK